MTTQHTVTEQAAYDFAISLEKDLKAKQTSLGKTAQLSESELVTLVNDNYAIVRNALQAAYARGHSDGHSDGYSDAIQYAQEGGIGPIA